MSKENIHKEVLRHIDDIEAGNKRMEDVINDIRKVCFGKSLVPEKQLLALFRKYDPKFTPISSTKERNARAALSKQAQEAILHQATRSATAIVTDLKLPAGKKIERNHRILFRQGTLEERQKLADLVTSDDKKALGNYIHNRLISKKDDLYALLEMDDKQLVANFYKHVDDLDLIVELQKYGDGYCEYTEAQQKDMEDLYHKMTLLSGLYCRIDVISSPYYAKYPVEDLEMNGDTSSLFRTELTALANAHGEQIANRTNAAHVGGPASELAQDYSGLRSFTLGTLDQKLTDHIRAHKSTTNDCIWATEAGTVKTYSQVIDDLTEGQLIFANVPNAGIKAYYNADTSGYSRNCKPEEASPQVVQQHMLRSVQRVLDHADAANPFFLSMFTGSAQYTAMEKQLKAVKQSLLKTADPVEAAKDPKTMMAVAELAKSAQAYLQHKKQQGLTPDKKTGMLIGRSANERKRLATAQEALTLFETLNFQLQYQADPKSTQRTLESAQQKILQQRQEAREKNKAKPDLPATINYTEQELCKTSKDDLLARIQFYQDMPPCQPSDAGSAITNLQNDAYAGARQLAIYAGTNRKIYESSDRILREQMAKVVLFDYILRERGANNDPKNTEPITAGPVEQAANKGFTFGNLVQSKAFQQFVGTLTPARIESFLNNGESKKQLCNNIVLNALNPTKEIVMGNQPAQPLQQGMEPQQPKAESGPKITTGL